MAQNKSKDNPHVGLIFDGRLGEDFKLTSGVWVHNAHIRASLNNIGKFDRGEATDKGYINQRAVLQSNMELVEQFYEEAVRTGIWEV